MLINYFFTSKNNKLILPIAVFVAGSRAYPVIAKVYYILPVLLLYFIVTGAKEIKLNKQLKRTVVLLLLFSCWSLITALWSSFPVITISRSLYFALISIGSLVGSYTYFKVKDNFDLNVFLPLNILIVALSLASLILNYPNEVWTGGNGKGFMGFAGHQNTLGALILFTIPASVWGIAREFCGDAESRNKINIKLILYFVLFALNLVILILTYSRASIASLFLALAVWFVFVYKWKAAACYLVIAILTAGILIVNPLIKNEVEKIALKKFPTLLSSREFLIKSSLIAAKHGGLFGLGYGISDPNIILTGTGSHYAILGNSATYKGNNAGTQNEQAMYIREKGSSVLALIEEVGYVGLILFLLPITYVVIHLWFLVKSKLKITKNIVQSNSTLTINLLQLIISFLFAFIIHAQLEAWLVGVGSATLPLFFVYMGVGLTAIALLFPIVYPPKVI